MKGPHLEENACLPPFPVSYASDASPCYLFTFLFAKTLEVCEYGKRSLFVGFQGFILTRTVFKIGLLTFLIQWIQIEKKIIKDSVKLKLIPNCLVCK